MQKRNIQLRCISSKFSYFQAEVWLKEQAQKEGWSKATKLKDRATAQGLIGLICQDQCATMVEVGLIKSTELKIEKNWLDLLKGTLCLLW